jgi:hypothetical protein
MISIIKQKIASGISCFQKSKKLKVIFVLLILVLCIVVFTSLIPHYEPLATIKDAKMFEEVQTLLNQKKIDYKLVNGNKLLVNSKDKNKAEFLIASTPELSKKVVLDKTWNSITMSSTESKTSNMKDYIEPTPSEWVEYMKPLNKYMYYRTQSIIRNDIEILWNVFPQLKNNRNKELGINNEIFEMESRSKNDSMIDANFNIESYERIKIKKISDTEVIALIHGSISYLGNDFDNSGGELLIKVFLESANKEWTVVETDEYTLPEYKEWVTERQDK